MRAETIDRGRNHYDILQIASILAIGSESWHARERVSGLEHEADARL